jgi:PPOX class probable F420-dependent enzyme
MPKAPLPPQLQEVLAKPNPAVIGTVRPDGTPNTVATWYLWENGRVLVSMDEGRRRLEYLRRDPHVSLTVLDGDAWYRHITLHGRAKLREDPDLADIDRIATHYMGRPYGQRDRGRVSAWIEDRHASCCESAAARAATRSAPRAPGAAQPIGPSSSNSGSDSAAPIGPYSASLHSARPP